MCTVQILHLGVTAIRYERESPGNSVRTALCYLRLDRSNNLLMWCKPCWSPITGVGMSAREVSRTSSSSSYASSSSSVAGGGHVGQGVGAPYSSASLLETMETLLHLRYGMCNELTYDNFDEGFIELSTLKEMRFAPNHLAVDLNVVAKRYAINKDALAIDRHCVNIVYGNTLPENKSLVFVFPPNVARFWRHGLKRVAHGLALQRNFTDRRMYWLKAQYVKLYYAFNHGPSAAPAVRIFGGRRWSVTGMNMGQYQPLTTRTATVNFSGQQLQPTPRRADTGSDTESKSKKSKLVLALRSAKRHLVGGSSSGPRETRAQTYSSTQFAAGGVAGGSAGSKSVDWEHVHLTPYEQELLLRAACEQYPLQNCLTPGPIPKLIAQSPRPTQRNCLFYGFLFSRPPLHAADRNATGATLGGCGASASKAGGGGRGARDGGGMGSAVARLALGRELSARNKIQRSITHTSELEFLDFIDIFKSFNMHTRKDLKDLFDLICSSCSSAGGTGSPGASIDFELGGGGVGGPGISIMRSAGSQASMSMTIEVAVPPLPSRTAELAANNPPGCGLITRVSIYDEDYHTKRRKIYDAIAVSSIIINNVGTQVAKDKLLNIPDLRFFFSQIQQEGALLYSTLL